MKNVIYYFSGTGNSMQVAKDIAKQLEECEVFSLAKYNTETKINAERIGIVFPVYFWGIPNIIKKFLNEIRLVGNPYIYAVATCGATAGASLIQVNDLLKMKNQKLNSGFIIKMPENYIIYYNSDSEEIQQKKFNDEKNKVENIGKAIMSKKELPIEKGKFIVANLFGKILNHIVARNFSSKDKGFNVNDRCTGCGECQKVCSVENITMENKKPTWNHHCEFCLGCLQSCPNKAINYGNKTQKRTRYINPNV